MGLWSGHKRRIEIAESFGQPIVTVVKGPYFSQIHHMLTFHRCYEERRGLKERLTLPLDQKKVTTVKPLSENGTNGQRQSHIKGI